MRWLSAPTAAASVGDSPVGDSAIDASSTGPARRLLPLTLSLAAAGAVAWAFLLPAPAGRHVLLIGAALVAAFVLTEATQLHVELRGQAFSVSLSEVPLVLGLFLVGPLPLLVARLAGALLVAAYRRTAPYKTAFNTALFTVEVALLVLVFNLGHEGGAFISLLATYAAVLVATATTGVLVLVALARLQGPLGARDVRAALVPLLVCGVFNTSLALVVRTLLHADPRSALPLTLLAVAVVWAYRAYALLMRRHRTLEQMQDFATGTTGSHGTQELLEVVLHHSRRLLSADVAVLLLPPTGGPSRTEAFVLRGRGPVRAATPAELAAVRTASRRGREALVPRATRRQEPVGWLAAAGLRDCVGTRLSAAPAGEGYLLVGDRLGEMATFLPADVTLLQLVAAQLSAALRNTALLDRLRHEATHDALTGLPNRTLFQERLATLTVGPGPSRAAVLLLDLDGFKDVNDTLGHHSGDVLLQEVGRRLQGAVHPLVTVARLGGDEFALLVPAGLADQAGQTPRQVADVLHSALRRPFAVAGVLVDIRASLGIAVFPEHASDGVALLQRADIAMYAAKQARVPVAVYEAEGDRSNPRRLALVGELRQAIEADRIEVHYQPKIALPGGTVVGVEALARWQHPQLGQIPPDDFVPIAEHTGLIVALTSAVLERALARCGRWVDEGLQLGVAVNVSPRGLLAPGFHDHVEAALARHGVPACLLTLEVTESSVMTEPDAAIAVLQRLHLLGVRLSVDDFGTGYSSLAYLQRLPVDEVKIDKSFVTSLSTDPGNVSIVRAICDLGRSLGLSVVAEGLEDERSRELLGRLSCDIAQGFLISRPLAPDDLDRWLTGAVLRRSDPDCGGTLGGTRHLNAL